MVAAQGGRQRPTVTHKPRLALRVGGEDGVCV
jgi:hypothetical protein